MGESAMRLTLFVAQYNTEYEGDRAYMVHS